MKNSLINSDTGVNGIFRCKLILDDNGIDVRAFIPGISNINPFNSNGSLDLEKFNTYKIFFPKIQWCCYNIESKEFINQDPLCWCMFENGDFKRPVVISYAVIGGATNVGDNSNDITPNNNSIHTSGESVDINMDRSPAGSDNSIDDETTYIFNKLIAMGASVGGASAIIGTMWGESSRTMSPTMVEPSTKALGLGQWLGNRKTTLINGGKVGSAYWEKPTNPYDIDTQIEYYVFELKYLGRYNSPTWNDLCKPINSEAEVRNTVFSIIRYFETPFTYNSPSELKTNNPTMYNNYYIPCITKAITYFTNYTN